MFVTCYMCDDWLIWMNNHWYCPNCDSVAIERLKYTRFLIVQKHISEQEHITFEEWRNMK